MKIAKVHNMKTTIVTGMLGAGKTTFIQNYLKNNNEKTVVLVNDFGKAGIDGEIISQTNSDTIELPSGCVCCTLRFDLITTLKRICEEIQPAHLMIEPSGIASPSGVISALQELNINKYTVICIIDPTEFTDIYDSQMYGAFFEDQINNADVILINKTDISESESIEKSKDIVAGLNPSALILETVHCRINEPIESKTHKSKLEIKNSHLHFETITLNLPESYPYESLKKLFHEMLSGTFGNIVRAKGLVQTDSGPYRFDFAAKRINIEYFPSRIVRNRIVIIGEGIDYSSIKDNWLD